MPPFAAAPGGGEEASGVTTTYRGTFSLQTIYNSVHTINGVVAGHCTGQIVTIPGTVTVRLDERGAGQIDMEWILDKAPAGQCTGSAPVFRASNTVSSGSSISMASSGSSDYESPAGTMRQRDTMTFTGGLDGSVVVGLVTISQDLTLVTPAGPGVAATGGYPAVSATVTLTRP